MKSLITIYVTAAILFLAAISRAETLPSDVSINPLSGHSDDAGVDWNFILKLINKEEALKNYSKGESWCFYQYKNTIVSRAFVQSQLQVKMLDPKVAEWAFKQTEDIESKADTVCIQKIGASKTQAVKTRLSLP